MKYPKCGKEMKLSDRLWYIICYGSGVNDKDKPKYAKMCAEELQADLIKWIDGQQVMLEPKQWYVPSKELKKMYKNGG